MAFGLFGKKKDDDKADGAKPQPDGRAPSSTGDDGVKFAPEKAAKFFQHARTVHDSTNYEYAAQLWLNGLRFEPQSVNALEGFFRSMGALLNENPKGPGRDTFKMFEGKGDVDKYLAALLGFGAKPKDPALAVRATEAAATLSLAEPTHWLGSAAMRIAAMEPKPKKEHFIKLMAAFSKVQDFARAVEAGETAYKLDPSDGRLAADVRNLAAQSTMSSGGYDQTGQAGGFRANVRDMEKQRQLEDAERLVKSEDTVDRLVVEAAADYQRRPTDLPAIALYIKRLMERGKDDDERTAREIAKKAYADTKEFRFRETEGDITLRRAARKLAVYREAAQKSPADAQAQDVYKRAREQFARMELEEFKLRVDAYPTEQKWKFELAKRLFEVGDTDAAIPLLQEAQQDAKYRIESLHVLGQAFGRIGYTDESIQAYRQALDTHKVATDETGMAINYGLMTALQAKGEQDRDLAASVEAERIASQIALQQFNFRDVRQRREAIKKLIADLRSPPSAGAAGA